MRLLCTASIIYLIFLTPVYSQNTTNDANAPNQSTCPVPATVLEKPTLHNPTCSLSSQPAEPVPEFLSFEEWKAKRIVERDATSREKESHSFTASHGHVGGAQQAGILQNETNLSNGSNGSHNNDHIQLNHSQSTKEHPVEAIASPRSHIPLIDRFNYASNECNARIQSSHKSAKSASSILSRKKDRYMLSPCQANKEKQYVIVELCEDIRIDTVQLANFEFFSGVFKDIRVSVAHTYTNDGQGWVLMGEYTAKNIRGIQSFHPQRELSPFYRYIRIDFLSYYGSEYFCPVSLLRVYGLTQMEEWKSDVWKAEWDGTAPNSEPVLEPSVITLEGRPVSTTTQISETVELSAVDAHSPLNDTHAPANETIKSISSEPGKAEDGEVATPDTSVIGTLVNTADHQENVQVPAPLTTSLFSTSRVSTTSEKKEEMEVPLLQPAEVVPPAPPQSTEADHSIKDENLTPITSLEPSSTVSSAITTTSSSISSPPVESPQTVTKTLSTTIILSAASPSAITSAVVPSGESVYRMIINRLNGLEANQTLYAKYFEEQGRIVNSRMERIEEDLGRLSAVVNSQQQHVSKLLERHRSELEFEHKKLLLQVENLAHEVLMEKRIGIAQLVILLAVLVFMALTRGSRGEPIRFSRASAAWNRGIQSSGDWVSNWRGSRTMSTTDDLLAKITEPTPTLQPAFNLSSRSTKHSFERSRRSSSSRRALLNDDLFQTPPRPSRKPTRSRQSSLRNREHTPVRQLASHGSNGPDSPTKEFRSMTTGSVNTSNQSKSSRPPATTNWRPGRSISLSGVKGLSGPFGGSTSNLPGGRPLGTKKLAKTAHMHEVKNRSRSGTVDGRESSLLSPMMEDPPSTAASSTFGSIFGEKGKENVHSSRAAGSMSLPLPDGRGTVSEGVLSNSLSGMASSSSIAIPGRQSLGIGIPFPSPDLDGDFNPSDEDHWVDEAGVDDRPPRSPSSPTGTIRRGFGSPRRSFIFSSSPPGSKAKFRFRRNDGGAHPS